MSNVKIKGYANGPCFVVAYLRSLTGVALTADDLLSIRYTVYDLGRNGTEKCVAVTGHTDVSLTLSDVMITAAEVTYVKDGQDVTMTRNFEHSIDISTNQAFPTRGSWYMVRYNIQPVNGFVSPIQIYVEAN